MLKRVVTFLLAVIWLSVANHCFVASALAAPANAAHDCCHPQKPASPIGPHGSPDKVCCQAFSPMTSGVHELSLPSPCVALPCVATAQAISETVPRSLLHAPTEPTHGPPELFRPLLISLTLAQNAPPV